MTGSSPWGRAARSFGAYLPIIGLMPRPDRPPGLTAIMRVCDEEDWLEPSIRSVTGVADQILVGDNGSRDETPDILRRLAAELNHRLEILTLPEMDIAALTNALLERARYRWVMRWDADFVAHTDGPRDIRHFREWLLAKDSRRYFMIYPRMIELAGDLFHQDPAHPTRSDAHCFVGSPALLYVYDRSGYEAPKVPLWYSIERYETPRFVHVNVKSDRRLFWSALWKRWLLDGSRAAGAPFEEYVRRVAGEGEAFDRAVRGWVLTYCRRLSPVDPALLPEYPALLRPSLERPSYRLIYRDGAIVGRQGPEEQTL